MLFEDVPGFRQVFLDGGPHPANLDPGSMDYSNGKWNGDALAVDTVGFNEQVWIGPPREAPLEFVCENNKPEHLVGR